MQLSQYSQCEVCKNLVEPDFFIRKQRICHACLKLSKWQQQNTGQQPNVEVELLHNGHWKAYLLAGVLKDLIASGHLKRDLFDAPDHVRDDVLQKAIRWNVQKAYVPDPKYRFEGLVRKIYLKMDLDSTQIMKVLQRSKSLDHLPTMRMKAPEWMLWVPKIDIDDPQLRNHQFTVDVFDYENLVPVTEAVTLAASTKVPFRPASLIFEKIGRYWIYFHVKNKGTFILDVDVDRKALE